MIYVIIGFIVGFFAPVIVAKILRGQTTFIPNAIADMESMMKTETVAKVNEQVSWELEGATMDMVLSWANKQGFDMSSIIVNKINDVVVKISFWKSSDGVFRAGDDGLGYEDGIIYKETMVKHK